MQIEELVAKATTAMDDLTDLLDEETMAISTLDLQKLAEIGDRKPRAVDRLEKNWRSLFSRRKELDEVAPELVQQLTGTEAFLRAAVEDNGTALKRAHTSCSRLVNIIIDSARRHQLGPPQYTDEAVDSELNKEHGVYLRLNDTL